jgi:hypothetical protein
MTTKLSCSGCRWLNPNFGTGRSFNGASNVRYGECRKNAPIAVVNEYDEDERAFPIVRFEDWCGDFNSQDGEVVR